VSLASLLNWPEALVWSVVILIGGPLLLLMLTALILAVRGWMHK